MKRYNYLTFAVAALAVQLLSSCTREPLADEGAQAGVAIPFSLAVSNASAPQTRMSDIVAQTATPVYFRGIEKIYIIPFKAAAGGLQETDERWSANISLPQTGLPADSFGNDADGGNFDGLVSNSNSHLYKEVYMRQATNRALVYGKATDQTVVGDSVAIKHRNGVLRHPDLEEVTMPADINFTLEPFIREDMGTSYTTWRRNLVGYLNSILTTSYSFTSGTKVTYRFSYPDNVGDQPGYLHPGLKSALENFTYQGRMMSGSYEVLGKQLTDLYRAVYPYSTDKHNSLGYNVGTYYYVYELSRKILTQINKSDFVSISGSGVNATITLKEKAPSSFGLPYGTFVLQYREGSRAFGEYINPPGGVKVPDYSEFCYPPALWYYVNSPIVSTSDDTVTERYTAVDNNLPVTWNGILSYYDGSFIKSDSRAAALKDPLQYGVCRMNLQFAKSSYSTIADSRNTAISIANNAGKAFPLTGVVVADQKPVRYDFTPIATGDNRFVYDSEVSDAYISNTTTSKDVSVLVLQTEYGMDVHFALEFVNNSGKTFYGINDVPVYPGSHFYLIGRLNVDSAGGTSTGSVFTQDRTTTVNVSFPHLKNAYTVVPDLREPQLVLGVEAQLQWTMTTPGTVPVQ